MSAGHSDRDRDWALGLAPQELAGQGEGIVFMFLCLVTLLLVAAGEMKAPAGASISAVDVVPVAAAAWLLSRRMAIVVACAAMFLVAAIAIIGNLNWLTAAVDIVIIPLLALLARLSATTVLHRRAAERAARAARAAELNARELEQAKSEFLRLASHELRGPVGILGGYLSMLADGSLGEVPGTARPVMPILIATVSGMSRTVDQMLDAARLEDSRLQLQLRPVDLAAIVVDAARNVELMHNRSHRVVVSGAAERLPANLDAERVKTVVGNLVSNAVKYSPPGTDVLVRVFEEAGRLHVSVTDEGIGISPTDQQRLFRRFGRISSPETAGVPGTGLGLYLSRELVRLHGGDLTLVSKPGSGSTFTATFPAGMPATPGASMAAPAPSRLAARDSAAERRPRIAG